MLRLERPATIALLLALLACEVTSPEGSSDGDGGLDGGSLDKATCPAAEPDAGSACSLPTGTTCQFGSCGNRIAQCDRGVWTYAGNPPPSPPCPTAPPAEDDPCPACWPGGACTYAPESCAPPDGGLDGGAIPNTTVATCVDSRWKLAFHPCVDGLDSGADVQGDADADAD
jgi:hypothetical protein